MVSGGDRGGISRRKQSLKGGWGGGGAAKGVPSNRAFC